jgi:hypothetical protein
MKSMNHLWQGHVPLATYLTIVLNASIVHQGTPFPNISIFVSIIYTFWHFFLQNWDLQPWSSPGDLLQGIRAMARGSLTLEEIHNNKNNRGPDFSIMGCFAFMTRTRFIIRGHAQLPYLLHNLEKFTNWRHLVLYYLCWNTSTAIPFAIQVVLIRMGVWMSKV